MSVEKVSAVPAAAHVNGLLILRIKMMQELL